ncbi:MAG: gas vesicle protein [Solirubrobacterales bacterium]
MASEQEQGAGLYNRRQQLDTRRMEVQRPGGPANLADILERVLDKGIVIAGDIQINLLDIELLTIKLRLLVASVERAQEMGINWWESDPTLSSKAQELEEENEDLRARLERLEEAAGLPAPKPGEEVVVETRRREVVEEEDGERQREVAEEEEREEVREAPETRDDLMRRAQELDLPGRSTMDKEELARAVADAEGGEP